jgi:hypothetical protein
MHNINPLKTQFNPISHLLALLGAHHILQVSRIRVNIHISTWCFLCFECFVRISEQRAAFSVYVINWFL